MNKDIKSLLINTFGTIFCLWVIFFFVTYILFLHNGVQGALKESWSASLTFFSVLATLGAAVIAAYLFNDWKIQHNKTVEKEMAWNVIQKFDIADTHIAQFKDSFYFFKYRFNFLLEMSDDEYKNLNIDLQNILLELKGVVLELGSYLESLRKYSVVAENTYFDDHKNYISEINLKILILQNLKVTLPSSIHDINNILDQIIFIVVKIEESNINTLLTELKTPT
ncbi:MAG: hypothetical protein RRZ32_00470 [Acinetobacter sp.]